MNVQSTLQFLLDQQAQTNAQLIELTSAQTKTTRQLTALTKLVKVGMRMLGAQQERLDALDRKINQLLDHSLGKRGNGRRRS